jgi:hypothetical protein
MLTGGSAARQDFDLYAGRDVTQCFKNGPILFDLRTLTGVREEKFAPAVSQGRSQQVGCKERGLSTPGPTPS